MILIITSPIHLRETAAIEPIIDPIIKAKAVAPKPITKEYLPPKRMRDKTSRPLSSVPNKNSNDGGLRAKKISNGSYGAKMSAKIVARTITTRTIKEIFELLFKLLKA